MENDKDVQFLDYWITGPAFTIVQGLHRINIRNSVKNNTEYLIFYVFFCTFKISIRQNGKTAWFLARQSGSLRQFTAPHLPDCRFAVANPGKR